MDGKINDKQKSVDRTIEEQMSEDLHLMKIMSCQTVWRSLLTKFFADKNFLLYGTVILQIFSVVLFSVFSVVIGFTEIKKTPKCEKHIERTRQHPRTPKIKLYWTLRGRSPPKL